MNKFVKYGTLVSAVVGGALVAVQSFAAGFLTIPTGTAATYTANVGAQFADAGTLEVIALAVGIPLFFYIVHQLMGLLPGRKGGRRN